MVDVPQDCTCGGEGRHAIKIIVYICHAVKISIEEIGRVMVESGCNFDLGKDIFMVSWEQVFLLDDALFLKEGLLR